MPDVKLNVTLMKLLQRLYRNDHNNAGRRSLVLPAFRLLGCLFTIVLCAISKNAFFTYTIIAMIFARLALMSADSISHILKEVLPVIVFTILVLLPSYFMGSPRTIVTITMKVFESVTLLAMLNETVAWKEITSALHIAHVPSIFILTMDMAIRFLSILGEYSNKLMEAVILRSVGRNSWKNSQLGGIVGTTFLKSNHMADATSEAMLCRGYNGVYQTYEQRHVTKVDFMYLCGMVMMFVYFLYLESVL